MNIYVGNLSYKMTESELEDIFGQFGTVLSAKIVTDRETNRSKGFAFVEMADDAAAQEAINQLNNKELGGRNLRVNEAKPREERPRRTARY
ncbi:MAG: RNA-binding protein [Campylobacteraceae bacterium]|nr:RNA-binding protein [Campylobacteraceae bacterium]